MKKILIYILLVGQFTSLLAEEISKKMAKDAVQHLLSQTSVFFSTEKNTVSHSIFGEPYKIMESDNSISVVAYVFYLNPDGYVVVAADDRIEPIIAYSNNSNFISANTPDNTLLFMIKRDIKLWKKGIDDGKIRTEDAKSKWNNIKRIHKNNGSSIIRKIKTVDGPYLTSKWGQGTIWNSATNQYEKVYNIYTPNNWAVGCNATAMAQIFKYYDWPITGVGSHSYSESGRLHSTNFGETIYDWGNTLDIYKGVVATQEQKINASLISYHAAVSLNMDFSASGSESSLTDAPYSLASYFRFTGHHRYSGSAGFYTKLRENMENGRPAHLAISGSGAVAHAIVADGYDSNTNFYHLNMGWSGSSNGWYNITGSFNAGGYTSIDAGVVDMLPEPYIHSITAPEADPLTVTVLWRTSQHLNAGKYELQQKFGSTGSWSTISSSITDKFYTTTVSTQGTYYYRVRAYADGGWYLNSYSTEASYRTTSNSDYRTKQSGDWTSPTTWEIYTYGWMNATDYPTTADGAISILNSHTITVNSNITIDQVKIEDNGKIIVADGQDLRINNGTGTDLNVYGVLRKEGSGRILYVGSGTTTSKFYDGSTFQLAGTNKYILKADWAANSTIEITGAIGGDMTSTYRTNQTFGNFTWNSPAQTSDVYFSGALTKINGNFELANTNGYEFRLTGTLGSDPTVIVKGNVTITNGKLNLTSGANNIYFVFYGNYSQSGGEIKSTGSGIGYFRFGSISAPGYSASFSHIGGNFTPDNIQINSNNRLTLTSNICVGTAPFMVYGSIDCKTFQVSGTGSFTLDSGAKILIGHPDGLNGNIASTVKNFPSDADYEYNGTFPQVTGSDLPIILTDGLIINNSSGVTLSQSTLLSGGNTGLKLVEGKLVTASDKLFTLDADGSYTGGSETSFVDGPMARTFNSTSSTIKKFPIGKGNNARELSLKITHSSTTPTLYTCEVFNSAPASRNVPGTIKDVSNVRYWRVTKGAGANIQSAYIKLYYNDDDGVNDQFNLRIVKSDGAGNWVDLGGLGSSNVSGSIESFTAFTEFSDFAIANSINGNNLLPVQLISFTAERKKKSIILNWKTATEINNYGFEIEKTDVRSHVSEKDWETIGFVEGHGNSNSQKSYSFIDPSVSERTRSYRLKQIDTDGGFEYSDVIEIKGELNSIKLFQNHPNPFNPNTVIRYEINDTRFVSLKIYNTLGQVVATLIEEEKIAGNYQVNFNALNLSSGVYFYRFYASKFSGSISGFSKTMKMLLLK